MYTITRILIAIIIAEHFYFLWLEMFVWTTRGPKVFMHIPGPLFEQTKTMAANQGLYNGFLAAGLAWTFFIHNHEWQFNVSLFFLTCIAIAGAIRRLQCFKKNIFYSGITSDNCYRSTLFDVNTADFRSLKNFESLLARLLKNK